MSDGETLSAFEATLRLIPGEVLQATALAILSSDELPENIRAAVATAIAPEGGDPSERALALSRDELLAAILTVRAGLDTVAAECVEAIALRTAIQGDDDDDDALPPPPEPPTDKELPRRRGTTTRITRRRSLPEGSPFMLLPGERFRIEGDEARGERTVRIERKLAEGGGGLVYLGRDEAERPVVVKTGKITGEPPRALQMERDVLEPLEHPNIVKLLGSHEDEAKNLVLFFELLFPNLVLNLNRPQVLERVQMRRAPGSRYLPPPPEVAVELIHDLLSSLEALHALGLVHHDVKLSNFLVALDHPSPEISDETYFSAFHRAQWHGVLIDGGGIRSQDDLDELNRGKQTDLPPIELTPIYAPPEALIGLPDDPRERPHYSAAVDVYGAALVAYTTITGYTPYSHLRQAVDPTNLENVLDVKRAERRGDVRPIDVEQIKQARFLDARFADADRAGHTVCRSHFDRDFSELLLRCVDPDPARRPTASDMKFELEKRFMVRLIPMSLLPTRPTVGERGPRLHRQRLFEDVSPGDPRSRLSQAAGGAGAQAPRASTGKLSMGALWTETGEFPRRTTPPDAPPSQPPPS